jgi:hypothetical protein
MTRDLVIWNASNVEHLADMIRQAEDEGRSTVQFCNGKRTRYGVNKVTHEWPRAEAERLLHDARTELAANPMPVLSENKEGREP